MNKKAHSNVPILTFNNVSKIKIISLVLILLSLNFVIAQNPKANENGLENANENATVDGGIISTIDGQTYVEVCVGDEVPDLVEVLLSEASGRLKQWIITDGDNNIFMLPEQGAIFDFDEFESGIWKIWHLSYNGIKPLVDPFWHRHVQNLSDLKGKYDLSNFIEIKAIKQPKAGDISLADGATEIEICAGDGISDLFDVTLEGAEGLNMLWVITDTDANILGTSNESSFDFEDAGGGICLIWHLSYAENVSLDGITNANDLTGCFDLSNPISVIRNGVDAGDIEIVGGSTEIEICAGDGNSDAFEVNIVGDTEGTNFAWVITNDSLEILDIVDPSNATFDLEGAGSGICLIWRIAYEDGLEGAAIGENAANLSGCFSLSNPITANRKGVNGGTITGGTENNFNFTVGDGTADNIPENSINLEGNIGANSAWVVTNEEGTIILELPTNYSDIDFDVMEAGISKIWNLSYENGIIGLEPPIEGDHLVASLAGCFSLSNSITVTKTVAGTGKVILFPNPAKSTISVDLSNFSSENVNIRIVNLNNIELYNKSYSSNSNKVLNINNYKSGLYFVIITNIKTAESVTKRVVIY